MDPSASTVIPKRARIQAALPIKVFSRKEERFPRLREEKADPYCTRQAWTLSIVSVVRFGTLRTHQGHCLEVLQRMGKFDNAKGIPRVVLLARDTVQIQPTGSYG